MYKDFPDMSDQPTNTGYYQRDWEEIRLHTRIPEDDEPEEDNEEDDFDTSDIFS